MNVKTLADIDGGQAGWEPMAALACQPRLSAKAGGARSLERTRLCPNSLFNREKTGNFYKIRAFEGLGPQVSHWKCADFLENSLRAITGKFFAQTGNFFEETGNLSPVSGKPSVVDPQVQILGTIRDLFTCTAAPVRSSSCRVRAL